MLCHAIHTRSLQALLHYLASVSLSPPDNKLKEKKGGMSIVCPTSHLASTICHYFGCTILDAVDCLPHLSYLAWLFAVFLRSLYNYFTSSVRNSSVRAPSLLLVLHVSCGPVAGAWWSGGLCCRSRLHIFGPKCECRVPCLLLVLYVSCVWRLMERRALLHEPRV